MFEKIKAALVALLMIFVFIVGGVLIGLKLPETDLYKKWHDGHHQASVKPLPTKVAVIQIPGTQKAEVPVASAAPSSDSGSCPGGVCKLPEPGETPHQEVVALQKSPDLTFYSELADKPTESGGSVLRVKKTPEVKKRKVRLKSSDSKNKPITSSTLWELRVCSLPHEIKARLERSKLIKKFPGVKIEPVQVKGKGTWYRVKICDIKNRELAEQYRQELSQKYHYKPIIRLQ